MGERLCDTGASVDSIDHWAGVVRALEARLEDARQAALTARSAPSFFAFFRSSNSCLLWLLQEPDKFLYQK